MQRFARILAGALVGLACLPAAVFAQASIAGVVKDTSGSVLPGVTVEASSPALIEKTRTVVSDGAGLYQIVNLPPGTYSVAFTLTGFSTVKREGIELTGTFTAPLNVELRVGALEETVTVTGETPIVDVQGTTQERVMSKDVIDTIPAGRNAFNYAALIPGMTTTNTQDVGGAAGTATPQMAIHGGRQNDQIPLQNGVSIGAGSETGWGNPLNMNPIATQEVAIDTAAVSAELPAGGVRINYVARDGGNVFSGTLFGSFANDKMQGSNFSSDLQAAGLSSPDSLKKNWDFNPGFGGPLKKDKVWFFVSGRYYSQGNYAGGAFYNLNENNPNLWTYAPDLSRQASNDANVKDGQTRLTWQVTAKNKLGMNWHEQVNWYCLNAITALVSPEAAECRSFPLQRQVLGDWTSTLTNHVLLEVGTVGYWGISNVNPYPGLNPAMITVNEQSTGLRYRADDPNYRSRPNHTMHTRAVVSYVSGSHTIKAGLNHSSGWAANNVAANQSLIYRFNNGVPNQLTELAYPFSFNTNMDHSLGLFAQDKWTVGRMTASYGIRFDYFSSSTPAQTLGPSPLTPTRNLSFPSADVLSYKDIAPKLGVAYDLFGNGKTAVRASVNKYLQGLSTSLLAAAPNPINQLVLSTTRSWTDSNGNFIPDCSLTNTAKNGECGAMANPLFGGSQSSTAYDPAILGGWGHRGYNWEFATGVQQQVTPRVSVDVGYFRRWYGNMLVTDNLAYAPSDYNQFSITAPVDARLPGGGGNTITGLYDLNPAMTGVAPNSLVTFGDNYGSNYDHWNGVDVNVNVRPVRGVLFQGGFSSGKRTTDFCGVVASLPEVVFGSPNPNLIGILSSVGFGQNANGVATGSGLITPSQFCHQDTGFQTQAKFLGSYTIPRVGVLVSGAYQNLPGPAIDAQYVATTAQAAVSLGRPLSNSAANLTADIVSPGAVYGSRLSQLDLRFGKVVKFANTKAAINFDLYNAMNANTILTVSNTYTTWQKPNSILTARFAKISMQFDF